MARKRVPTKTEHPAHRLRILLPLTLLLSLNRDLAPHAQREVRKTVDMVVALRGTGEAPLIDGIGLGQERTLEWRHLIRHVLREYVRGAFWNTVRPERHVVRATALIVIANHVARLDRQVIGVVLVLGSIEDHVHIVGLARCGWGRRRGRGRRRGTG